MKTKSIHEVLSAFTSEDFIRNFQEVVELGDKLKEFSRWLANYNPKEGQIIGDETIAEVVGSLKLPPKTIRNAITVAYFFGDQLATNKENWKDLLEDIAAYDSVVRTKEKVGFDEFLKSSEIFGKKLLEITEQDDIIHGSSKHLRGVKVTVELKPKFDKDYETNKDNIEKYRPKIEKMIPIASLRIRLSDGKQEERLFFNVGKEGLSTMIKTLQFGKIQLEELEKVAQKLT